MHDGTRFALADYKLNGQGLNIVSAYSAAEGRELMRANPDVAVVLLDVIMESDTAGLELVEFIRKQLKNDTVRIILRTGQPGQAPERRIIVDYDINDYKAKTELTADKLFTALTAALRSYQQLQRMIETRRGLEIIIEAAGTLFDFKSMQRLAEGVLTQIASLLKVSCAGILVLREAQNSHEIFSVLAGSGCYSRFIGSDVSALIEHDLESLVREAFTRRQHEFSEQRSVLYIQTMSGREVVVVLEAARHLSETDRALVEIFCSRLSIAFDNVILYEQLQESNARLEERVAQRTQDLMSANRRLAAQWSRLRQANNFKSEILGTVAHDLKNPLAVILGRTEILKEMIGTTGAPDANMQAQIDYIRNAAKQLTEMVDDLVSDAMTDALDISVRREAIDLAILVEEVAEANRPLAERKSQVLTVTAPRDHIATVRRRPGAGRDRQPGQQRHQVQPDRRRHRRHASDARATASWSRSRIRVRVCRRRTSRGCSDASSACPPSRPPAKARPASAFRSPSASSICTAAGSRSRAPGPDTGATFIMTLPVT